MFQAQLFDICYLYLKVSGGILAEWVVGAVGLGAADAPQTTLLENKWVAGPVGLGGGCPRPP